MKQFWKIHTKFVFSGILKIFTSPSKISVDLASVVTRNKDARNTDNIQK